MAIGSAVFAPSSNATVGDVKLQLEAGERELWLIERKGVLEHRLGMVEVDLDIEEAVREAKEKLSGH